MLKLSSIDEKEYNIILDDILVILNLPEWEKNWIKQSTKPIAKKIEDTLNENKTNLKLAKYMVWEVDGNFYKDYLKDFPNDLDLALIAIKASSENFKYLSIKLKENEKISYEIIKTQIREWNNYFEIKKFIELNYKDKKKELLEFYKLQINEVNKILKDDLTKNLINIDEKNPDFIKLLKEKNIITWNKKKININPRFLTEFEESFKKKVNIKWKNEDEIKKLKLNFLINYIWINAEDLNEETLFILNSIIDLIVINDDKKEQEKDEIIDENLEKQEKETKQKKWDKIDGDEEQKETKEDIFEKKLNYSLPNSTLSFSSSWNYSISSWETSIEITLEESQKMTSLALKNYYKFYQKLSKLWLNFLWDKYKTEFLIVMSNSFSIDYLYWEWISEGKTLSVLNLIWRNIWIPEKEVIWKDWKPTKEIKCFNSIEAATFMFEDINKKNEINWETWSDGWPFSKWPVENKLIANWLIDSKRWVLNISKWK